VNTQIPCVGADPSKCPAGRNDASLEQVGGGGTLGTQLKTQILELRHILQDMIPTLDLP